MAVPGLIMAGSSIQRFVQPGFRRSLATVKFGAVACASCFGVAGHVALQAGRAFAGEQLPRHGALLIGERLQLLRR